jgi:hypothetical protein
MKDMKILILLGESILFFPLQGKFSHDNLFSINCDGRGRPQK